MTKHIFCAATIAAVSATAVGYASTASAATLFTSTDSFSNQLTELSGTPALRLSLYTPGVGETVTSVTISFSGTLASSGTVRNNAAQSQSFNVSTVAGSYVLTPNTGSASVPSPISGTYDIFAPNTSIGSQSFTNVAAGATTAFGPVTRTLTGSQTYNSSLSSFFGTGNFLLSPSTLIGTNIFGGGGNITSSISTFASASATITYDGTTSVPEPFTVLGTFLGGAAALRMRKKLKSAD